MSKILLLFHGGVLKASLLRVWSRP